MLGQIGVHIQKNEVGSLTLYTKINTKWIRNLNARAKTITLLEVKIIVNICDFVRQWILR